jgi:L-2-hydroxyglutarate oxidase
MYDFVVLGGGIVGISTAWQLQQRLPDSRILLLEKEQQLAFHQTGHNSGVIHSGIYYQPGSLKAQYCRAGLSRTIEFCETHEIPYEQCGKLLVATDEKERERLIALQERAAENQIDVEWLDSDALREAEPNVTGIAALLVPATGIVDYRQVSERMAQLFRDLGGELRLGARVNGLDEDEGAIEIDLATGKSVGTRFLVSCAGLMADRVAQMLDIDIGFQTVPYRGEYYRLPAAKNSIVKRLIYPVPDPDLPFLGVHLTRMIDGSVTVGPNAVQGWKREGYGTLNVSVKDILSMMRFPGFWKVTGRHLATGIAETRDSLWKRGYLKRIRKYCPSITIDDLLPHPVGIRAQAVLADGTLVHDFLFAETTRSLHVCNAPSPAATAAIPIGEHIARQVADKAS